jgi:hypothetical protein
MCELKFHPHVNGINGSLEPIIAFKTDAEFLVALQQIARDELGDGRITKNNVDFYFCEIDKDCSEAFLKFQRSTGWDVHSVLINDQTVGYSDGPWLRERLACAS